MEKTLYQYQWCEIGQHIVIKIILLNMMDGVVKYIIT